jgi:ABC-2 type transport system ATP-binding protein
MTDSIIETNQLTYYYGRQRGILDVDLRVQAGEVFGFLGPNGAGKTTTLRLLLDIIRPTSGTARIFGLDCRDNGVTIRQRVGYLPGELSLHDNMRVNQYFELIGRLRDGPADSDGGTTYWQTLADRLDLDIGRKIRQLSRGNRQKVGLVAAFMNRPDLLILDEPTTGLDPLVQQTVMELVRETNAAGATVFFSSHILPEVQAVCDRVGIIREGRLVATERVDTLIRQSFRRVRFRFGSPPPPDAFARDGVAELDRADHQVTLEIRDHLDEIMRAAAGYGIVDIETIPVSLEEIFLAYYGHERSNSHA